MQHSINLAMMAKRRKVENVDDEDQNAKAVIVPHLPNLVMHHILGYVPTKLAIRTSFLSKNLVGIWSSLPVIDLQEESNEDSKDNMVEHTKFTNLLARYLELRDKESPLEKLRIRMRYCCSEDRTLLERLLSFAATKSVKELDISLRRLPFSKIYSPSNIILSAKTLTAVSLEYVEIEGTEECLSFPFLKTIFLKNVRFGRQSFMSLISSSPSIEHISVNSCYGLTVNFDNVLSFTSSSLKSLEVSGCGYSIKVRAANLESFTLASEENIAEVTLERCRKLKCIKIHARRLSSLDLLGCHDSMKATINAPCLRFLSFNGYMKHQIIEETKYLTHGIVAIRDRKSTFESSWNHFSTLRDFLKKGYGSCKESLRLFVFNLEALTFPKDFRQICSPPLPLVKELQVDIVSYPTEKIDSEFWDSLRWMAPKANLNCPYYVRNINSTRNSVSIIFGGTIED